uniref:Ubiquitin-like domain-containing protein n=1 Tax=Oryzias latipes TaxID=8090 RepID=A0A3B3I1A9_ORYLA
MEKIHLFVDRSFLGKQRIVDLCESDEEMQKMTVLQLKEKIAQQIPEYRKNVGLIFENKMLDEDSKPLSGYGIQHMSVVRLLLDFSGGESPAFHEGYTYDNKKTHIRTI